MKIRNLVFILCLSFYNSVAYTEKTKPENEIVYAQGATVDNEKFYKLENNTLKSKVLFILYLTEGDYDEEILGDKTIITVWSGIVGTQTRNRKEAQVIILIFENDHLVDKQLEIITEDKNYHIEKSENAMCFTASGKTSYYPERQWTTFSKHRGKRQFFWEK